MPKIFVQTRFAMAPDPDPKAPPGTPTPEARVFERGIHQVDKATADHWYVKANSSPVTGDEPDIAPAPTVLGEGKPNGLMASSGEVAPTGDPAELPPPVPADAPPTPQPKAK